MCRWSRCSIGWELSEREISGLSPSDGMTILLQRYIPDSSPLFSEPGLPPLSRTAMPKTYLNPRDTKCSQSGSISSCKSHPPAAYRAEGPHGEPLFGVSRRAPRRLLSRSLTTNTTTCPASARALFCMERKAVLPFLLSTKKGLMAHKALMAHTFFSCPPGSGFGQYRGS